VVLIRRFRHGTRDWHLEAPRGAVSGNLPFEEDARRELKEEIDAEAQELVPLGQVHPSSGCLNEVHHLFLARIAKYGTPEKHEAILEIQEFTIREFEKLVAENAITDGPTLCAFLHARLRGFV
jgi:ADP-ribose pyrophosphatase